MSRLTARTKNGHAYLVNVKPDEQEVNSPHKNTLQCILDCFERLAAYEDIGTPEEFAAYKDLASLEQVQEWATAAAEERLVIIPDYKGWVEDEDECICPICGSHWNYCDNDTERFKHCPNCGERLEGGEE